MTTFLYVEEKDLERCEKALLAKLPVTVTGLSRDGVVETASGQIQSLRKRQSAFKGYPALIIIRSN
jgi:hypothetical protein